MSMQNTHALHIPDLLSLICDLLDRNDSFSLMRTSKSIFPGIASQVWREVEAQVLLELIVETPSNGDTVVDFSRFNIYAPFVRQLRVYGRTARYFRGERRHACMARAHQDTLLSNIVSLTLLTSNLYHDSDALYWLDLFLTPSVRHLVIQPIGRSYTAWVSYPATFSLLQKIVDNHPTLEKIEFYPMEVERIDDLDKSTNMLWPLSSQPDLSTLTQLRRITSSIGILNKVGLTALGALPRLQFLSVHGCEDPSVVSNFLVPDESFPALTHLTLLDVGAANVPKIMNVKALTQGLTSLKIKQWLNYDSLQNSHSGRWLSQTLPQLLRYTFLLRSFHYDASQGNPAFRGLSYHYGDCFSIEPSLFLQATSKIPLQQVTLLGISFIGEDLSRNLVSAFPRATFLRIPDYSVPYPQLKWFTGIPNLRHLSLGGIRFTELPEVWEKFTNSVERFDTMLSTIAMAGIVIDLEYSEQITRYFLALWPKLRHIGKSSNRGSSWLVDNVNVELAKIRHLMENSII